VAELQASVPLFEVDYHPSSEDVLAYFQCLEKLPSFVRLLMIAKLIALLVVALGFGALLHFKEGLGWLATGLLVLGSIPIAGAIFNHTLKEERRKRFRSLKQSVEQQLEQVARKPTRFSLSPEGITLVMGETTTAWKWSAIPKVETTLRHVFFDTNTRELVVVARRLFPDYVTFRDFSRKAAQYHEQSRATNP
jgi:hypothetical protein